MAHRLLLLSFLISAPALAIGGPVSTSSKVENGRVFLVLTNDSPGVVFVVDEVTVPVHLKRKQKTFLPTETRTVPAPGTLVDRLTIDLGNVQEVFDGGGTKNETLSNYRKLRSVGMESCHRSSTPVEARLSSSRTATTNLVTSVEVTYCLEREG